jgi:hypothetical protein
MLTTHTQRIVGRRKILLLDLVHTFATRPNREWRGQPYSTVIWSEETYRLGLLRRIQEHGFYVVILTARSVRYASITLENIKRHTDGWVPDCSCFNYLELDPPTFKGTALHSVIFPAFGPERRRYFALESNARTRLIYDQEGIECSTFERWLARDDQRSFDGL